MGLTVGVIGLGRIGAQWDLSDKLRQKPSTHLYAWLKTPGVEKIVISDVDPVRLKDTFLSVDDARARVRAVTSTEGMPKCDIVSVATPADTHYQVVKDLVVSPDHPKLIFCEKPLALTLEDAKEMVQNCAGSGVILAVNHTRRWDSIWRFAAGQILTDVAQTPNMAVAHFTGDLMNVGIHMADLVNWFGLGGCCEVFGHRDSEYLLFELDVFFQKKRIVVKDNGWKAEVYVTEPSHRYDGIRELGLDQSTEMTRVTKSPMLEACEQLTGCIRDGEKPACTGEDGVKALERVLTWEQKVA